MSTDEYRSIIRQARRRLADAEVCGTVRSLRPRDGETVRSRYTLSGLRDCMVLTYACNDDGSERVTVRYASLDYPTYMLFVENGTVEVEYEGADEGPSVGYVKQRLEAMSVGFPRRVPYGYVVDGLVTALLFASLEVDKIGEIRYSRPDLHGYVLEGHEWPIELRMEPTDEGAIRWFGAFWELSASGKIIELAERIKKTQRESYSCGDDQSPGWLDFSLIATEAVPEFGTGRYNLWHPASTAPFSRPEYTESYIKAFGVPPSDNGPFRYRLRDYFQSQSGEVPR